MIDTIALLGKVYPWPCGENLMRGGGLGVLARTFGGGEDGLCGLCVKETREGGKKERRGEGGGGDWSGGVYRGVIGKG